MRLVGGWELVEHVGHVALRAFFGRIERLPSTRCECKIALARVFFRGFALNQAASFEIAQHAAQISGIEVERARPISLAVTASPWAIS